jgi:hypothetical protein
MGQRLIISESERNQIRGLYAKPLIKEDTSEIEAEIGNMIESGVIGRDIVQLPPNDLFDANVFGSYHYYKWIHGNLFKEGTGQPIAYYKLTQPEAIEAINNAKYNRGNGHPLTWGFWHADKNDRSMIKLMGAGTEPKKQSGIANLLSNDGQAVLATIPTPKGIMVFNQNYNQDNHWFKNPDDNNNIYLQFLIDKSQAEAYIDLMENVVKIKDIPDPAKKSNKIVDKF